MKKIIPLLLALVLLLSLGSAALADGTGSSHTYDPDDSAKLSQTITTVIPDNKLTWYLEIPTDITINQGGHNGRVSLGNVKITVDSGELSDKQKIEASLTYDGVLTDEDNTDNKINYLLSDKNAEPEYEETAMKTGTAYVVGTKTKDAETYNAPDAWVTEYTWDMAEIGNYEGTVVYSSKLVETGA